MKQVLSLPKAEGAVPAAVQTNKKIDAETSSVAEGNLRQFKSLQNINSSAEMNHPSSTDQPTTSTLDKISRTIRRSASLAFNTGFSTNSMDIEPNNSLPVSEKNKRVQYPSRP